MPEKEVKAVAEALQSRFRQALAAGRLSQVPTLYYPNQLKLCIISYYSMLIFFVIPSEPLVLPCNNESRLNFLKKLFGILGN